MSASRDEDVDSLHGLLGQLMILDGKHNARLSRREVPKARAASAHATRYRDADLMAWGRKKTNNTPAYQTHKTAINRMTNHDKAVVAHKERKHQVSQANEDHKHRVEKLRMTHLKQEKELNARHKKIVNLIATGKK